ncbi:hypothetical protein [Paradesulfitobacterium ferrireducens]|uniref:hypothetical protein n=1 Tax=Paradesulfitobacterium ferrireducens TaxID=2816476 RepID=UPI001A8E3243|nr:hypothetical protein [Paradesulfitobacterium ferrireducens]
MARKQVLRSLITLALLAALAAVIILSQQHDPTNPHSSIPREQWLTGSNGHTFAVKNNQQPAKQCYPCHEKQGLGGVNYCTDCHTKSGISVQLPSI